MKAGAALRNPVRSPDDAARRRERDRPALERRRRLDQRRGDPRRRRRAHLGTDVVSEAEDGRPGRARHRRRHRASAAPAVGRWRGRASASPMHYRSSAESAEKLAAELPDAFTVQADLSDGGRVHRRAGEAASQGLGRPRRRPRQQRGLQRQRADALDEARRVRSASPRVPARHLVPDEVDFAPLHAAPEVRPHRQHLERSSVTRATPARFPYTMTKAGLDAVHEEPGAGARGSRHPRQLRGAGLHRYRDDRGAARRSEGGDPRAHSPAAHGHGPTRWPTSWRSSPPAPAT